MKILFNLFLILHITGGITGLITGTLNIIGKKGGKRHKLTGNIFVYAMLVAGFSSLILAVLHPNYFLFMVGIFTLYMTGTGFRYLRLKMLNNSYSPGVLDWAITWLMLCAGILFIVLGAIFMLKSNYFGVVFLAFGLIGLLFVKRDYNNYKGKSKLKNYWLTAHLQRMTGAYIASLTAFLVVNSKYSPVPLPSILVWLSPTVILVPFIVKWSRKYAVMKK